MKNKFKKAFIGGMSNKVHVEEEEEKEKFYLVSSDDKSSGFWFLCKDNDGEVMIGTNEDYFKAGGKN